METQGDLGMRRSAALTAGIAILFAGCQSTSRDVLARAPTAVPAATFSVREQECLALAMYWEARGEGEAGMAAVGWTILNRVASPAFPSTACAVVYDGGETPPCQFSWYCDGRSDRPRDWSSWQRAMRVGARLLTDPLADPTRGALYFHARHVRSAWHGRLARTASIGGHVFYR
jgi:spore germination cell wall hydrolase CwlJ-like protein